MPGAAPPPRPCGRPRHRPKVARRASPVTADAARAPFGGARSRAFRPIVAGRSTRRCYAVYVHLELPHAPRRSAPLLAGLGIALGLLAACAERPPPSPPTRRRPRSPWPQSCRRDDHRVGRVHRPPRSREHRRRPPARVGLDLRRPLPGRRPGPSQGRCCSRSTRARSRPRSIGFAPSCARRSATASAPPPSCSRAERLAGRERDVARGARTPRRRRRGSRGAGGRGRSGAARRRARTSSSRGSPRRSTAASAAPSSRAGNLVSSGPGEATLLTTRRVARSDLRARSTPTSRPSCATAIAPRRQARQRAPAALPDSHGARRRTGLSRATGTLQLPRQPARSEHRHDPRPRRLPQPRSAVSRRGCSSGCGCRAAASYHGAADSGPRRRHRPRQALRVRRRRATRR